MRVSIIIFITIILLGMGIYYVWQKGIPQGWAKDKIINAVEKRLNGKLKIKSLHFKFPNQVILEGITLSPNENLSTPIVEIKGILCKYNIIAPIIHLGRLETVVSKIVVIDPEVYFYRDKVGNWNFASLFKPQLKPKREPPAMTILIKKAKLKVKDEIFGTQTTLFKIYASYYPQGPPPYFYIRIGHQIKISGNIYNASPLQANFNLKITKKDISGYAGFLKTNWANLLQGQISGNLRGKIQNKNINLESGNLSINEGLIKLTHILHPITDITANFSLAANRGLIAEDLKFKFRDIDVTTQRFFIKDIYKNEALIEFVTSEFYLKELGDIFPYLNKLNLKSVLKFKGEVDFRHSFRVLGDVELFNQTHTGYKFPIMAKFKYKDKAFDNFSLLIGKETQIKGKLDVGKELVELNAKFDKSNLIPLLALSGMKELKNGTVSGEVTIQGEVKSLKYGGNLKVEIDDKNLLFKEITAKLNGDKKSMTFISQLIQPQGKIDIQGKGIRDNIDQPFSISLTARLNQCNLFNRDVSANVTFDGNLSTKTKLIGGGITAKNIVIDKNSYFDWQGSLIYDHPTLNISTSHEIKQLALCGKITFGEPITTSIQIKTQNINLSILTKEINGTFDGEFDLKKISKTKTTISGKSVKVNLAQGRNLNGDFEIIKIENKVYIDQLVLNEPERINMSVKGAVDLTYPQATFIDLEGRVYNLKYKDLILNTHAEFKGYLSKSQLSGLIIFKDGKFNDLVIDHGEVDFSYANHKFVIKKSDIVLDSGGVLTTFGTLSTKGKVNLKFSLLGMNYQDMPYPYFKQFKGQFDLAGEVQGDVDNPIILASLESNEVTVAQQRIAKISGRINYSNNEIRILQSKINDQLFFQGTFRTKDEYLTGMIQLKDEKLTTLASLLSLPAKNLHGIIKGQIKTNGNLDNLVLKGELEIDDFHIPGLEATHVEVKFALENKILSFQKFYFIQADGGKMDFKKYQLEIKPNGEVILIANIENFIIANITFDGKVYFTGIGTPWNKASGTLNAKNLLINQSDAFKRVAVGISYENGLLEFLPLPESNSLSGKIRFISNKELEIKDIKILKSQVEKLKINGSVELSEKRCDLRFVMDNSDLKILPLWFREIKRPEGKVDGWLHVCGNFDEPQFNGALMVDNGALSTFPFAKRVTELQGQIRIVNNWFVSNFLKAKIGKSILVMKSNIPFTLKNIDIELKSSNNPVPVSIPGFLEGSADVDIQIKGNITLPIGSGNIKIVNAKFTYPPRIEPTEGRIQWKNLMITVGKNVRYYNEYVDVRIKRKGSWVKVSSEQDELRAAGIVYAQAGGKVNYLGKNFTIKNAYLEFREGYLSPYLSGYAITHLGKRRIALTYEGYIGEAKPTLQALGGYPPMNEEQIVNALLIERSEYATIDSEAILRAGFEQVVGKEIVFTLLMPIEKQISQLLGLDVELKTSALERMFQESSKEGKDIMEEKGITKSTSIFEESEFRIGRFITDDLYISYRGILKPWEEEEFARLKLKQELELEYYISGNTSLKYKFVPEGVWRRGDEHEVMIEREVRF